MSENELNESDSDMNREDLFLKLEEYLFDMDANIRTIKNWIMFWSLLVIISAVLSAIYGLFQISSLLRLLNII
jgi:hypothetical protein